MSGTSYLTEQSSTGLYLASGCSDDWAMATVAEGGPGIPYSYTLEMRPGPDGGAGGYGFELPAEYFILLFFFSRRFSHNLNLFLFTVKSFPIIWKSGKESK